MTLLLTWLYLDCCYLLCPTFGYIDLLGKRFFWASFDVFWTWTLFMDLTTFLLEMATLLLDLRTLLLDLALPKPHPLWIDSPSCVLIAILQTVGARAVLRCNVAGSISIHCVVQCLLPFLPSSQFLLFTPLPAFLSYTGAQLGVNLGESASLGDIHLVSISKLPLLCLSSNFLHFLHSLGLNIYTSPLASLHFLHSSCFNIQISSRCPSTISSIHLVSYVAPPWPPRNFLQASCLNIPKLSHTCASQQLPAFMGFQYLGFSPSSLHNFLHASSFGFNIFALIWFEYLYFPALASLQTSCAHLVSISKIPARCPSTTSCIHPVSISKLPPLCPSATSWVLNSFDFISGSPVASPHFLTCV